MHIAHIRVSDGGEWVIHTHIYSIFNKKPNFIFSPEILLLPIILKSVICLFVCFHMDMFQISMENDLIHSFVRMQHFHFFSGFIVLEVHRKQQIII